MADNKSLSYLMDIDKNNKTEFSDIKSKIDDVRNKVTPVQEDMAQLVENVQKQVDELRTIVENSPAGVLPPTLMYFYAESTDEGIKLTYKAGAIALFNDNAAQGLSTDEDNNIASLTKGVMFRYSETTFPMYKTEGTLAFVDEDLFSISESMGSRESKDKENVITGLTNGKKYYISAFPYSTTNVYNEAAGYNANNRQICTWTGTKGTLTVNVTNDYNYKTFGEYTATMTPTSGGQAITKTQSGPATIVFSGLEAGEYTLSFSAPQYFTAPQSQSVTVVAGQSQTVDVVYEIFNKLSQWEWEEIYEMTRLGYASEIFSVGDKKSTNFKWNTGDSTDPVKETEFTLMGFNLFINKNNPGNTSKNITFCSLELPLEYRGSSSEYGWSSSGMRKNLNTDYEVYLPDIHQYTTEVALITLDFESASSAQLKIATTDRIFIPSATNVGASAGEGGKFPYFSSANQRKLGKQWGTRSCERKNSGVINYIQVNTSGTIFYNQHSTSGIAMNGLAFRPVCFCIG